LGGFVELFNHLDTRSVFRGWQGEGLELADLMRKPHGTWRHRANQETEARLRHVAPATRLPGSNADGPKLRAPSALNFVANDANDQEGERIMHGAS
jgi:hypothetical protein